MTNRRSPRSATPRGGGLAVALTVASSFASATALAGEVTDDAQRVETLWSGTSQRVLHLAPLFMIADEVRPIPLSPLALTSWDSQCTTIGVLGAPTMDFSLEMRGEDVGAGKSVVRDVVGARSVAGALTLVRCGDARSELDGLVIHMKSPQGALEVLVARGAQPAPSLDALFPERAAGPSIPLIDRAPPPVVAPRSARVADAEQGILQNGGKIAGKQDLTSDRTGQGSVRLRLAEGCHRLVVVAESRGPSGPVPVDVDCDLYVGTAREPAKRDRSFASDGVVATCVAAPTDVLLRWTGAPGGAATTVLQGFWPIPTGIPAAWPARARAGLTDAAVRRHVPLPEGGLVWEAGGVTARTSIPVPVTAGECYVVGVGAYGGEVRAIRLTVQHGAAIATDSGQAASDGAAVSFCAQTHQMMRVEVNAIGSQVAWLAGLWRVGRIPLGLEESK